MQEKQEEQQEQILTFSEESEDNQAKPKAPSKISTAKKPDLAQVTPQKSTKVNVYDKSQSKQKMEGSNQPDFKLQLHTVNSLNIDSVEKKMWNSNTKNQGPKSNLIDEEMPVHMLTNIKDKRARQ